MKRTKNPAKEAEYRKRAADLVAQMTLHEKVSQMLSWAPAIERLGIPAYNWWSEGNGMLDQMLRGFQTDKTVRVHFHFDGISHSNDSQLSLKPGTDGRLTVCSHGILDPEKMQKQFFGYDITDSDKQVLRQTGNI